ncbi:MAG: hypothetical protein KME29_03845 [Calothrix sp. FI2-JRJ7]|jgi:hypothetical protein|nr:hypothetical protein [Calothrix sp. FI2-JRJ7]MBW4598753.1 hypothetical protein [Calothrix sp. FI2-JRJ7]
MNVYCDGSAAAEILFSLTGGREGRLISYAPPVVIDYGQDGYILSISEFFNPDGNPIITTLATLFIKANEKSNGGYDFFGTEGIYSTWYDSEIELVQVGIAFKRQFTMFKKYYLLSDGSFVKSELFYQSALVEDFQITTSFKRNNLLLITDNEGVLYAYEYPEGFTPAWQVNCIGCNEGECAGSDGKGGVTCMDCVQMDRDIQQIKKTLSN